MATSTKNGRFASVRLGTYIIAGIGNYSLDGWTNDTVETTAFGTIAKTYEFTMQSYGTVKFAGMYMTGDTTGQDLLLSAWQNQSKLTNLRFYIDSTSYYTAGVTSQSDSGFLMQSYGTISFDKAQVGQTSFSAQVSGVLALV